MTSRFAAATRILINWGTTQELLLESLNCSADDLARWLAGEEPPDEAYDDLSLLIAVSMMSLEEASQLADRTRPIQHVMPALSSMSYAQMHLESICEQPSPSLAEVAMRIDIYLDAFGPFSGANIPHRHLLEGIAADLKRFAGESQRSAEDGA